MLAVLLAVLVPLDDCDAVMLDVAVLVTDADADELAVDVQVVDGEVLSQSAAVNPPSWKLVNISFNVFTSAVHEVDDEVKIDPSNVHSNVVV